MDALIMTAQLLAGLSILIILHEAGHYIAARCCGIRVDKFYLFFDAWGFKLFHFTYKGTEYGIGWLPMGGYCKIAGMIDESIASEDGKKEVKENVKRDPQPWEYRAHPAWQRFLVSVAGVVMNLIAGILVFSAILKYQQSYLPTQEVNRYGIYAYPAARELGFKSGDIVYGPHAKMCERFNDVLPAGVLMGGKIKVERNGEILWIDIPSDTYRRLGAAGGFPLFDAGNHEPVIERTSSGSGAEAAGLCGGDKIISVNGTAVPSFGYFKELMRGHKSDTVQLGFVRGTDTLCVQAAVDSAGMIGIYTRYPYQYKNYSWLAALKYGTGDAFDMISVNARGLGKIFTGKEKARESLQGPVGIAAIYGGVWDWFRFWYITGMLSLALAFMNILPIPGLDGGHLLFSLYEMVTRRKVSDKVMINAQMIGMALIMALFVFVIFNDLARIFG